MKHRSILRMFTAAVLCCTLCGSGMTVPAFPADENEELPVKFDLRGEGAMTSVKHQYGGTCTIYSGKAAIESFMIKNGMADNTIDLSESHFLTNRAAMNPLPICRMRWNIRCQILIRSRKI